MRNVALVFAAALAFGAVPRRAAAQDTTTAAAPPPAASSAISPGMTEADVRARWGNPVAVRTSGEWKFLYYRNEMERAVGWWDTVFLQNGQVVDCIARGAGHAYTGQSSAPPDRLPERTLPRPAAGDSTRGTVTGVRVTP